MPAVRAVTVPVVAEPDRLPDGLPDKVHAVAGKPLNATLPVAVPQVGCVMVPIVGADGTVGWALTTALPDAPEVHPPDVTVNV